MFIIYIKRIKPTNKKTKMHNSKAIEKVGKQVLLI